MYLFTSIIFFLKCIKNVLIFLIVLIISNNNYSETRLNFTAFLKTSCMCVVYYLVGMFYLYVDSFICIAFYFYTMLLLLMSSDTIINNKIKLHFIV